tara:strand:+ start:707 stop:1168 length:462 start_codon:yes stop_codon:yes gene_type:complete
VTPLTSLRAFIRQAASKSPDISGDLEQTRMKTMRPIKTLLLAGLAIAATGAAYACPPGGPSGYHDDYAYIHLETYNDYGYHDPYGYYPVDYYYDYYGYYPYNAYGYGYGYGEQEAFGLTVTPNDLCLYYGASDGYSSGEIGGCITTGTGLINY